VLIAAALCAVHTQDYMYLLAITSCGSSCYSSNSSADCASDGSSCCSINIRLREGWQRLHKLCVVCAVCRSWMMTLRPSQA
jgi:DMSO/TMAO reductase YedYZ heme-binding membrane subunit